MGDEPAGRWYNEDVSRFRDALRFSEAESGFSFFDIDHAVRAVLFDTHDPELLRLVATKLSVAGNKPVDLSPSRIATLRGQIETHLKPVLRTSDFDAFDLQRVIALWRIWWLGCRELESSPSRLYGARDTGPPRLRCRPPSLIRPLAQ